MGVKGKRAIGNWLGIVSVVYLVFLWTINLNPLKWNLRFPGGVRAMFSTMFLAMFTSSFAGLWGKRAWLVVAAAAIFTFIYLGFFVKSSWWY